MSSDAFQPGQRLRAEDLAAVLRAAQSPPRVSGSAGISVGRQRPGLGFGDVTRPDLEAGAGGGLSIWLSKPIREWLIPAVIAEVYAPDPQQEPYPLQSEVTYRVVPVWRQGVEIDQVTPKYGRPYAEEQADIGRIIPAKVDDPCWIVRLPSGEVSGAMYTIGVLVVTEYPWVRPCNEEEEEEPEQEEASPEDDQPPEEPPGTGEGEGKGGELAMMAAAAGGAVTEVTGGALQFRPEPVVPAAIGGQPNPPPPAAPLAASRAGERLMAALGRE